MKTRLITAGVAIIVFLAVLIFGEMNSIVITIAIALVNTIMCGEYLSAKKLNKNLKIIIPSLLFALLIPVLSYTEFRYIPYYLFALTLAVITVVDHEKTGIDDVIFAFAGVLLLSISMSTFAIRSCALNYRPSFWVILIVGIPWISDTVAYFVGSAIGKRKLCPVISPKKTVEGAVAGVIGGTVAPLLFGLVFQLIYGSVTVTYWILPIIGLLNSVISIFGDLLFSVLKRSCDIKDFGSIMPGHGGLLDRFDSVILCSPVVFIISQFVTIIV